MARIAGYFEYDDDLTPGRSKDGGIHHNLSDHGRLKSHGKFVPHEEAARTPDPEDYSYVGDKDKDDDVRATNADIAVVWGLLAGAYVWEKSQPYVKEFWDKRGHQGLKTTWTRIAGSPVTHPRTSRAEETTLVEPASVVPPSDVVSGQILDDRTLTRTEAQILFAAALRARHFSEATLESLRRARIVDGDGNFELVGELENLAPQQIENAIQRMLNLNLSVGEETMVELRMILERSRGTGPM